MLNQVTIAPMSAVVLDRWDRVLGTAVELPGGTELIGVEDADLSNRPGLAAAFVVNDPYFPAVVVGVTTFHVRHMTPLAAGTHGPRVGQAREVCAHHRTREAAASVTCLPCYYARWRTRAIDVGLLTVDGETAEDIQ
jgi:hypothetical protein